MWLQDPLEPHDIDTVARLHYRNGSIFLAGRPIIDNVRYFFLCEGKPASHVIRTQFPPPCTDEQVTTTEAFTSTATESTTSFITSSSEDPTTAFQGPTTTRVQDTSMLLGVTTPLYKNTASGGVEPNSSSCAPAWPTFNVSSEELLKLIQLIQQELLLDKSNLSATKRKLRTAKDERPSAHAIGSFGVVILILLCAIIVIPDTASVLYALARQMGINKTGDVKVSELKNKDNKNGGTI
ncbi:uncharacterized protein [Littorina saxatilis]|uniref:uncharacterized protein n=1 Tax=Littorina saxatilis TaxID=31220 RepID=UPI0038B61071